MEFLRKHVLSGIIEYNGHYISVLKITPEVALEIMRMNVRNRRMYKSNLVLLRSEVTTGAWEFNGKPILISNTGVLLDGQHRLQTIIDTGVTLDLLVVWGLSESVWSNCDTGKPRTFPDYLSMLFDAGEIASKPGQLSSATGYLWTLTHMGYVKDTNSMPMSLQGKIDYFHEVSARLEYSLNFVRKYRYGVGSILEYGALNMWAALHAKFTQVAGRGVADNFFAAMRSKIVPDQHPSKMLVQYVHELHPGCMKGQDRKANAKCGNLALEAFDLYRRSV